MFNIQLIFTRGAQSLRMTFFQITVFLTDVGIEPNV